ncbi:hypothetical protein LUZ61_018785 [Rhynchospora tenuis]|uniref:Transcription repressor n=1 Tax=Rhynchospora tenuis TaxID=198213 RepID=A0AAD5ZA23_9POAL|nr:hypothetical protein LUZ61_018785 [Rhynchospora tenuis]
MAKKKRTASLFAFGCGCGGSKSISVSDSSDIKSSTAVTTPCRPKNLSSTDILTPTITSASTSSPWDDDEADKFDSSSSTPSFSGLLRQLNELEQTVMTWQSRKEEQEKEKEKEKETKIETRKVVKGHKRSKSERGMRVLEESVVVVKESEDPLGDFRRSMLQMIVEKEIVDKEELSELLRQFLALNSPQHHHLILRAFAEIWEEISAGYDQKSSEFLVHHACHRYPTPLRF